MSYNKLRKGRFSISGQEYFVTTVVAGRRPVFLTLQNARACIEVLRDIEESDFCLWLSWVLMPDHFHGLLTLCGDTPISEVMRQFKGRSVYIVNRRARLSGRLWQPGFWDRALRKDDDRIQLARYIVANPLRRGLVDDIGSYSHWDSVWL